MAIINGGLHGQAKKRVGNIVYRKWRNLNVAAKYQPNISNPDTEAQKLIRTRFAAISDLAGKLGAALILGFKAFVAGTKTPPKALFIKKNWPFVHADTPGTATIDYSDLQISDGPITAPDFGTIDLGTPQTIKVPINDNSGQTVSSSDEVYLVIHCPEVGQTILSEAATRSDDSIVVEVPGDWNGTRVHVWGFATWGGEVLSVQGIPVNHTKGDASPSVYIGSGDIS